MSKLHRFARSARVARRQALVTAAILLFGAGDPVARAAPADDRGSPVPEANARDTVSTVGAVRVGIERYIRDAMASWGVPGLAIAVVEDDRIVYARGFGVRNVETREPVNEETIFPIGSVTKSMTATAVAMLVDDGKMDWDAPIKGYLPNFEVYDQYVTSVISMRDIACHRTGIEQANYLHWGPVDPANLVYHPSRDDIVRAFKYLRSSEPFRVKFAYKNEPWVVAGAAVAAASGTTWDQFLHNRLFKPLGMDRTSTSVRETTSLTNVSSIHVIADGRLRPIDPINVDVASAMGSVNSSVLDLAQYVRFHLGNGTFNNVQLLSAAQMHELHEPQMIDPNERLTTGTPFAQQASYSLGWWVQDYRGLKLIHHAGEPPGGSANVFFLPEKHFGVVVLANGDAMSLLAAIALRAIDAYLRVPVYDWNARALALEPERLDKDRSPSYLALMADRAKSRVPNTKPSVEIDKYAGIYHNNAYGGLRVTEAGGKLTAKLWTHTGALTHWNYDVFKLDWDPTHYFLHVFPERDNLVRFEIDEHGRPSTVSFSSLGTFVRIEGANVGNGAPATLPSH
ncbi:MAG TPA: serine hydrolase [Steroidobacteraceae bacterium]|jgi:CubicO group peptidase (beta-lactamase class C family)|nr:serine hydrolase [Steroidobacteraceae bacterium]